ncbi:MAG: M56 family metallopeptidase [Zavarzinella sp.]
MIEWFTSNLLTAAALALLVWVLTKIFKPAPSIVHLFWLIVMLKLIAPPLVAFNIFQVETPLPEPPETVEIAATATVNTEQFSEPAIIWLEDEAAIFEGQMVVEDLVTENVAVEHTEPLPASSPPIVESRLQKDLLLWVGAIWVIGSIVVVWKLGRGVRQFARIAAKGTPPGDDLIREVAVVANRMKIRMPLVKELTCITSPLVWCCWRPTLLWPAGLEKTLPRDGLHAVIVHELAHLKRRDHWVRVLEMIATVVHWWNPLFWMVRQRVRLAAEFACDHLAAKLTNRRSFAEALLQVCSFQPQKRPAPAVGIASNQRREFEERLSMIMSTPFQSRLAFGLKLFTVGAFMAAIPTWTVGQVKPSTKDVKVAVVEQAPSKEELELAKQIAEMQAKLKAIQAAKQKKALSDKPTKSDTVKVPAVQTGKEIQLSVIVMPDGTYKIAGLNTGTDKPATADSKQTEALKLAWLAQNSGKVVPGGAEKKEIRMRMMVMPDGSYKVVGDDAPPAGTKVEEKRIVIAVDASGAGKEGQPKVVQVKPIVIQGEKVVKPEAGAPQALSRATYKLTKEQLASLDALLKSSKGITMEVKAEKDGITVTTTPAAQATINSFIKMLNGEANHAIYFFDSSKTTELKGALPAVSGSWLPANSTPAKTITIIPKPEK